MSSMIRMLSLCIVFFSCVMTTIAQKVYQYSFDEVSGTTTTIDSVNGTTYTIQNNFNRPERISGVKGNALRLDGWSTWVRQLSHTTTGITNQMTIEAWFATESFTAEAGGIVSQIAGPAGYSLEVNSFGKIIWAFHADGQFYVLTSSQAIPKYQWNHIVATIDLPNQTAKIYLNGVEVASESLASHTNITFANGTTYYIGRQTNDIQFAGFTISSANGALDEITYYSHVLSSADVMSHYQQYSNATVDLTIDPAIRHAGDDLRPRYHPMPNTHWTNEPYGLIYYKGKYHLFFQKNPNGPYLYFMHWGHLSSPDLVHWTEEKVVLAPDEQPGFDNFGVWSGAAILDDAGEPYLFYTGVNGTRAGMGYATPTDSTLETWTKGATNPVITQAPTNPANMDFRDPYVFKANGQYYMIIGSGKAALTGGMLFRYTSTDLTNWLYSGILYQGFASTSGQFWEMPFFYQMNATDWVLQVVPTPTSNNPARSIYWIGTFQPNGTFHPYNSTPQSFELMPELLLAPAIGTDSAGQATYIGIIPESRSLSAQIAAGWRQTFSIARVLTLLPNGKLAHRPHPNLALLRNDYYQITNRTITTGTGNNIPEIATKQGELNFNITAQVNSIFEIQVYKHLDGQEFTAVVFDIPNNKIKLDRRFSTLQLAVEDLREADYTFDGNEPIDVTIFLDHSTLEIFINDTEVVSCRVYPSRLESNKVDFVVTQGQATIDTLDAWQLANTDSIFTGLVLPTRGENPVMSNAAIQIIPNPNQGQFEVQITNPTHEPFRYQVFDVLGRVVQGGVHSTSEAQVTLPLRMGHLSSGLYFFQGQFESGVKTVRFMVE